MVWVRSTVPCRLRLEPARIPKNQTQIVGQKITHQLLGHFDIDYNVCKYLDPDFLSNWKHANVNEGRPLLQDKCIVHYLDVYLAEKRMQIAASLLITCS